MLGDFTGLSDDVDPNRIEEFKNVVREKGIPEENIWNFIYNGNGIILFPPTIPFTWYVNIRKQINLFKMSFAQEISFKIHYFKKRKKERNVGDAGNVSNWWLFYFSNFVFPQTTVHGSEKL